MVYTNIIYLVYTLSNVWFVINIIDINIWNLNICVTENSIQNICKFGGGGVGFSPPRVYIK
jgi:hypothetical protein